MGLEIFRPEKSKEDTYVNLDIVFLSAGSEESCPDYCVYDSGHNCFKCERFSNTLFYEKNKSRFSDTSS